jgi:hypothetical protein
MIDNVSGFEPGENFVLGLEENAIDSLVHAVEHFLAEERPTDLKYTILHIFHAIELFLKARLAMFDSELIYEKPKKDGTRHTIRFGQLKELLCKQGVVLSEQDEKNLAYLQEIRNSIEHHRIDCSRNDIEEYVGCAVYFLETFLFNELGISLKKQLDKVDEDAYQTLSKAWFFHFKRMDANGIPFHPKRRMDFDFFMCEQCDEESVVFPDPRTNSDAAYCFCCFSYYKVYHCPHCEINYISDLDPTATAIENSESSQDIDCQLGEEDWPDNWSFCENCMDRITDS